MGDRVRLTEKIAAAAKKEKDKNTNDNGRMTDGFEYDKSKAKILQGVHHNLNISLGTMIGAMRELAMLRGSDITPDGKLGGRGFVMEFKEMKASLSEAIRSISDVTDSIGDELTNPKWGLKEKEVKKIKEDKDEVVEDAEDKAQESIKEIKDEITPEDVKEANYIQLERKYRDIIDGSEKDIVSSILRKRIQANLLR